MISRWRRSSKWTITHLKAADGRGTLCGRSSPQRVGLHAIRVVYCKLCLAKAKLTREA